jgi:tetratricopeptide (TPR) repeat protein
MLACNSKMSYEDLYSKINKEIDKGNFKEAIALLDKAIKINYKADSLYTLKSFCLYNTGYYKKAEQEAEKALLYNSQNDYAYYMMGISKRETNLFGNVSIESAKSDKIYIDSEMVNRYVITLHDNQASGEIYDMKEALLNLNKAIEINGTCGDNFFERGKTYYKMSLYKRALTDFDKAIILSNHIGEFFFYRGMLYKELDKSLEALNDFNKAISLKEDAFYYANRGYLKREQLNDKQGGCDDLKKAKHLGLSMTDDECK